MLGLCHLYLCFVCIHLCFQFGDNFWCEISKLLACAGLSHILIWSFFSFEIFHEWLGMPKWSMSRWFLEAGSQGSWDVRISFLFFFSFSRVWVRLSEMPILPQVHHLCVCGLVVSSCKHIYHTGLDRILST